MDKCLHSGKNSQCCIEKAEITATQMSATNSFYTHTCKIFGSVQGSTATYSCFSSFGNLSFCKMLPVMPLSRNGKHEAITRILAIGAINESQLFRWGLGLTTHLRVRSKRSSCHLNESQKDSDSQTSRRLKGRVLIYHPFLRLQCSYMLLSKSSFFQL